MFLNEEKKELKDLSEEEQLNIFNGFMKCNLEFLSSTGEWVTSACEILNKSKIFRVPPRKTKIEWSFFDKKWRYFAIADNEDLLLFTDEPILVGDGDKSQWRFNNRALVINDLLSDKVIQVGDEPWQDSLIERPKGE